MALSSIYYVSCLEDEIPNQCEWESSQVNAEETALLDAPYCAHGEYAIVYEISVRAIKQVIPNYTLEAV